MDDAASRSRESLVEAGVIVSNETNQTPASRDEEFELCDPVPTLPDGLLEDVAHAIEETEKTRDVAKAIAHLLIAKGVLTLEEPQAQIALQKGADSN
jgi:hypothetical protein